MVTNGEEEWLLATDICIKIGVIVFAETEYMQEHFEEILLHLGESCVVIAGPMVEVEIYVREHEG